MGGVVGGGVAYRDVGRQGLALRGRRALVEVEDPRPRRALLVVAVAGCHCDRQAGDVGLLYRPLLDQPGEHAHADSVRGAAAGDSVDLPAGADRVAVAGLEVGAADAPAHGATLSARSSATACPRREPARAGNSLVCAV